MCDYCISDITILLSYVLKNNHGIVWLQRETVIQVMQQLDSGYAVVCDDLKKVYNGKDGNPDKFAVKGVSLALPNGECLGILGPNGAGKSSFISMVCHWIPLYCKVYLNSFCYAYILLVDAKVFSVLSYLFWHITYNSFYMTIVIQYSLTFATCR
jgi:ABC-type protease/lipase transport system fused ATPase/permease subunit